MENYSKFNHTKWDCKYHLIWIPKYRKKMIYGNLRKYLGEIFRELALQKESNIIEGHLMEIMSIFLYQFRQNIQYLRLSAISKGKV